MSGAPPVADNLNNDRRLAQSVDASKSTTAQLQHLSIACDSDAEKAPTQSRDDGCERPSSPSPVEKKRQNASRSFFVPAEAIELYAHALTAYEREEIMQYKEIYFVGDRCNKSARMHDKFDDDSGFYVLIGRDHIAYRYEVIKMIGRGTFGQVVKVYDHKNKMHAALKIIRNKMATRGHFEVGILYRLHRDVRNLSNTVRLLNHFRFRGHTCIVLELLSFSLYELIKINKFQGLDMDLVVSFAVQIAQSLKFLHEALRVIHCDLKPENILLKQPPRTAIRLIDFGNSCLAGNAFFTYVQSRFYRAPEVVLRRRYDSAIDVWSLGCILCELATGQVLFPGEDEFDQMALFIELLGVPPASVYAQSAVARRFFNSKGQPRYCQLVALPDGSSALKGGFSARGKYRGPPASRTWSHALRGCRCQNGDDDDFVDFVRRCLKWDPSERIAAHEMLRHPWMMTARIRRRSNVTKGTTTVAPSSSSGDPVMDGPTPKAPLPDKVRLPVL